MLRFRTETFIEARPVEEQNDMVVSNIQAAVGKAARDACKAYRNNHKGRHINQLTVRVIKL